MNYNKNHFKTMYCLNAQPDHGHKRGSDEPKFTEYCTNICPKSGKRSEMVKMYRILCNAQSFEHTVSQGPHFDKFSIGFGKSIPHINNRAIIGILSTQFPPANTIL